MEMGADFMPLYPMWISWFSFYARRRTSSHSNPSCSHRRFAREHSPPSPIPVMPGIRRRPPGEGPPGAGSKESGAYPQGARDPAPAAAVQRLLNFFDLAVQLNDAMQRKAARLRDGIHFSANQIHVRLQLLSHVGIAVLRRFVSRSPAAVSASPA